MGVVSKEVAEKDINGWLDSKKIYDREENTATIETLVKAVENGVLVVTEEFDLVHTLLFPTQGEKPLTSLKYKNRLAERDIKAAMKGVSANDMDARMTAYIYALTGVAKGLIDALDTSDTRIAKAVVVFFL